MNLRTNVFMEVLSGLLQLCAPPWHPERIGTPLILQRDRGVSGRSRCEFVVTAAPSAKQQFTDHTGQRSASAPRSQSTSDGTLLQKQRRNAERHRSLVDPGRDGSH